MCTNIARLSKTLLVAFVAVSLTILSSLGCSGRSSFTMVNERCASVQRVAVAPFTDGPGSLAVGSGNAVVGLVTEELHRTGRYEIVERSRLREIMDELDLQTADLVNPATAAKVGKLAGVDAIMTGSVTQYDRDTGFIAVPYVSTSTSKYLVGVSVRLIDVKDGQIIYTSTASARSGSDYTDAGRRAVTKLLAPLGVREQRG